MTKRKLILCRGIQGSGKTFYAKKWADEDPEHRIRINNDDIRNMLGKYWVPEREPLVTQIKKSTALCAMAKGYDIIVDNMNLNPKEVKWWEDLIHDTMIGHGVYQYQYDIESKDFFDISVDECIKRDSMRSNPIGEDTIRKTWNRYKHFIQTYNVEKLVSNLLPENASLPYCIVVDMDSTLCFNTSKRPWFGPESTELMLEDTPNMSVLRLIQASGYPIIICTGRNQAQKNVTLQWLEKYNIHPTEIYLREDGDYRKGVEVKTELMNKILEKYNVLVVFEDCTPIVDKFREMGLTVLQPNKGL